MREFTVKKELKSDAAIAFYFHGTFAFWFEDLSKSNFLGFFKLCSLDAPMPEFDYCRTASFSTLKCIWQRYERIECCFY